MTDNEIIKALECCTNCSSPEVCKECPYLKCTTKKGCYEEVLTDALALINRQKAEIERLEAEIESKQFRCDSCDRIGLTRSEYFFCVKRGKARAVKEFAERLKEAIRDVAKIEFQDGYYYLIGVPLIDNLVKEFTEGKQE